MSVPHEFASLSAGRHPLTLIDDNFAAVAHSDNNLSDLADAATARANLGINAALIGALFATWFTSLPTAPSVTPGWWNDSGIPTYS
jgi:hypothetical protein